MTSNKMQCLSETVKFAQRRAVSANIRYANARFNVQQAISQNNHDLRRIHTLEAWRARAEVIIAIDDRRAAMAAIDKELNPNEH